MSEPLTAGEPLAPSPPDDRKQARRRQPPPTAQAAPRRCSAASCAAWWAACSRIGLLVGAGRRRAAAISPGERFSADLPDVDGLRNYQPPVMSRVYAGDARLLAELATERRIFVPYSAIPDMVKQAFVSAEDQNFWTHTASIRWRSRAPRCST